MKALILRAHFTAHLSIDTALCGEQVVCFLRRSCGNARTMPNSHWLWLKGLWVDRNARYLETNPPFFLIDVVLTSSAIWHHHNSRARSRRTCTPHSPTTLPCNARLRARARSIGVAAVCSPFVRKESNVPLHLSTVESRLITTSSLRLEAFIDTLNRTSVNSLRWWKVINRAPRFR